MTAVTLNALTMMLGVALEQVSTCGSRWLGAPFCACAHAHARLETRTCDTSTRACARLLVWTEADGATLYAYQPHVVGTPAATAGCKLWHQIRGTARGRALTREIKGGSFVCSDLFYCCLYFVSAVYIKFLFTTPSPWLVAAAATPPLLTKPRNGGYSGAVTGAT
jgi:hypothetical protein